MKLIRLFAAAVTGAAGEQRQLLREDLALQTAEDIAGRAFRRPARAWGHLFRVNKKIYYLY